MGFFSTAANRASYFLSHSTLDPMSEPVNSKSHKGGPVKGPVKYLLPQVPTGWNPLAATLASSAYDPLRAFLVDESRSHTIYPSAPEVFHAMTRTPLDRVRVLLLGQDPYHGAGQAHGLAFSVRSGVRPPPSLRNMLKELESDIGCTARVDGSLERWAVDGVLLLNAVLTVRAGEANAHRNRGWEQFTDEIIRMVNAKRTPVVFALWGAYAKRKAPLIDTTRHAIVEASHPSPLSAWNGFLGTRPFSRINDALSARGTAPIDWCGTGSERT